jgi:hypothetical protein
MSRSFNITLTSEDYITKQKMNIDIETNKEFFSMSMCELDFISYNSMSDRGDIILGLKFLRKYYTVFDYDRKIIGFNEYGNNENPVEHYTDLVKDEDELDVLINDWIKIFGYKY